MAEMHTISFRSVASSNGNTRKRMHYFIRDVVPYGSMPVDRVIHYGLGSLGMEVLWNLSKLTQNISRKGRKDRKLPYYLVDFAAKLDEPLDHRRHTGNKPRLRMTRRDFVGIFRWPRWMDMELVELPEDISEHERVLAPIYPDSSKEHTLIVQTTDSPIVVPRRPKGTFTHILANAPEEEATMIVVSGILRQSSNLVPPLGFCSYWEVSHVGAILAKIMQKMISS